MNCGIGVSRSARATVDEISAQLRWPGPSAGHSN